MKKLQKIFLIAGFAVLAMSLLPVSFALADSNFTVQFQTGVNPLFSEANFLPGQDVVKWVDVTNNTSEKEIIGVEAKNYTICSENCFSDQLNLEISDGNSSLYESSLTEFFSAGQKKLSDLAANATQRYYFTITFVPSAGNQYQSNEVGFDFDIGIFGQETIGGGGCGDGVCGDGETCSTCSADCGSCGGGGGGGGFVGGGGGGGYFGGDTGLIIFNEASSPVLLNQTDITWETNHAATSRVIYSSQYETHIFDLTNPPNYGYAHSNVEDSVSVILHSMNIAGLVPGVTYYYRVVSRGSFAISEEHSFTAPGIMAAETVFVPENPGPVAIAGTPEESAGTEENPVEEQNPAQESQSNANVINPFLASISNLFKWENINFCSIFFVLIVILIILLLSSLERNKKGENRMKSWILSIFAIVVLIIIYGLVCPDNLKALIIVAVIVFTIFLLFYYLRKDKQPS